MALIFKDKIIRRQQSFRLRPDIQTVDQVSTFDSLSLNDDESESGILESESDEGSETSADRYFVIGSQSQSDTLDEDYQDSMCPSSVMSSSESTIEDVDDLLPT